MRRLALALLLVATAAFAQEEDGLRELAPAWTPGLEWTVETHPLAFSAPKDPRTEEALRRDAGRTIRVRFQVLGRKDLGGVACHEVLVTSEALADDEVVLLVRQQDHSVKELRKRHRPSGSETAVPSERVPFVLLEHGYLAPFDLPLFPRDAKDQTRAFDLGAGRKLTQTIRIDREKREVEYKLETLWHDKPLVSTQVWKLGQVFWSRITRTWDGKEEHAATLDEKSVKLEKRR